MTEEQMRMRQALVDVTASLIAAVSLLRHTPTAKLATPSNRMFELMLKDYEGSIERARELLYPEGG